MISRLGHPALAELRDYAANRGVAAATRLHVSTCTQCTAEIDWVRRTTDAVASLPGHDAPSNAWNAIAARVSAGETVLLPSAHSTGASVVSRFPARATVRVAVLILFAGGAASATMPGSPVRAWLQHLFNVGTVSTGPAQRVTPITPAAPVLVPADTTDAVFLMPSVGQTLTINVDGPNPGLRVRVILSNAADLEVRATKAAAQAQFRSAPGRLGMTGGGPGEVVLMIPRGAARVQMQIDGRVVLEKRGDHLSIRAPSADTVGTEITFPARAAAHSN